MSVDREEFGQKDKENKVRQTRRQKWAIRYIPPTLLEKFDPFEVHQSI